MDGEVRIWSATWASVAGSAFVMLLGIAIVIATPYLPTGNEPPKPGQDRLLQVMYGGLAFIALVALVRALARLGHSYVADAQSIREEIGSQVVWQIPWAEYGGWADVPVSLVTGLTGIRRRIAILDRSGSKRGVISLREGRPTDRRRLFHMLHRKLPADGLKPERKRPPFAPSPKRGIILLSLGAVAGLAGGWGTYIYLSALASGGLDEGAWQASTTMAASSLLALVSGIAVGLVGVFILVSLRYRWTETEPGPTELPAAARAEFFAERWPHPKPLALEPGKRYAYVDPQSLLAYLRTIAIISLGLKWLVLVSPAALLLKVPGEDGILTFLPVGAIALGLAYGAHLCVLNLERWMKATHDQFEVQADNIIVRRGAESWSLPMTGQAVVKTFGGDSGLGSQYYKFKSDGKEYRLDPRYLVEID